MTSNLIAGRFELIREIGEGAMGSVWLAKHLALGSHVVIKLIKSEFAKHPEVRARFQREARIAAQMRSVHVVQVLDHGVSEEGAPYLVMEHLEGATLRERLVERNVLSMGETAAILAQLCRAMTKAHEAKLVHRDLKPENIFLARDLDLEVVKILDFGIVKVPDALALDGVDPTVTGALLGTPSYMSPEQAQGLRNIDFRSDLWSLGVVVYECLTGIRPFLKRSLGGLIHQITIEPIPKPSQSAPEIALPPAVDDWMARALSRDPTGRFSSAWEMADAFARIADGTDARVVLTAARPPAPPSATAGPVSGEEATRVDAGADRR